MKVSIKGCQVLGRASKVTKGALYNKTKNGTTKVRLKANHTYNNTKVQQRLDSIKH